MKIIFLQGLKRRLFTRTPVLAALLLTAVVTACGGGGGGGGAPTPGGSPPSPMITANCVFAEDNSTQDCGLIALPQVFDYATTYNITVGEVLAGKEIETEKLRLSNFNFTQIIQGDTLNHPVNFNQTQKQLTLLANATAVNITISGIDDNVFGEFYIDLVQHNNTAVTVRYTISITPVNDPPVFEEVVGSESQFIPTTGTIPASYRFANIPFNSTAGYSVGNVSTTDVDDDAITYGIDGGTDDTALFQISSTGEITLKAIAVNTGDDPITYTFNITASDRNSGSARIEVTVKVLPDNQAPVFRAVNSPGVQFTNATGATPANYTFAAIPFNLPAGYSVGNVSAMDPDGDTVSYNISGGDDDNDLFQVNLTTGEITLKVTADTAVNSGNYTFNVIASDGQGGSTTATISVEVLPNQAPMFRAGNSPGVQFTNATGTTPANYSFADIHLSSPTGHSVGNVSAMDPDGDTVSYNISGGADGNVLFMINSETGEITLKAQANTPGEYRFNVTASDSQGANTTATISVTVIDATPPVFTSTPYNFDLPLAMASTAGVVVGNVSAVDAEGTDFGYSLARNNNVFDDLFELAAADNADGTRNIILRRAATFNDFPEAFSSITFQVVATHQFGGLSSEADITVTSDTDGDGDGVMDFYDAFPDDGVKRVNGSGESSDPYIISNIYQLQAIAGVDHRGTTLDSSGFTNNAFLYGIDAADQLTKHYKLANNINASATNTTVWDKPMVGSNSFMGHGWTPIAGAENQVFRGSFAGDGYHIHNLSMNLQVANNKDTFGLFGTNGGNISAVGLTNINMQIAAINGSFTNSVSLAGGGETESYTLGSGALVGTNNEGGSIKYAYSTGIVTVDGLYTGGLVGVNIGKIVYSYSGATVTGRRETGGLVGAFGVPDATSAEISSSYATGDVTEIGGGIRYIQAGGLVGTVARKNSMHSAKIYASYAGNDGDNGIISVKGHGRGGPLIGTMSAGYHTDISYSHWTNSTSASFERDAIHLDSRNSPEEPSFTFLPESGFSDYLFLKELENATLDSDTPRAITTGKIFTSPHWDPNLDDPGIERGWIFREGEIPALYANRTLNSVTTSLMPPLEAQACHRRLASDACGTYDAVE